MDVPPSSRPTIELEEYDYNEQRYNILKRTNPEEAERLMELAKEIVHLRWQSYEDMASWHASSFAPVA